MAIQKIHIPDIGGSADVDVIELLVAVGDTVDAEQSLITLEGDKASMEVPSPVAGVIKAVHIKIGDKVSEGTLICDMEAEDAAPAPTKTVEKTAAPSPTPVHRAAASTDEYVPRTTATMPGAGAGVYAGPHVRRYARELGVDLTQVEGTAAYHRVTAGDVQDHVKGKLANGGGSGLPDAPDVDFSKFGEIETQPLSKINKLSGANLHRNWVLVPHVTQFDEADITELEAFRKANKAKAAELGARLTPLVFLMKAAVAALKAFPTFNASLDSTGENLILKKYFHIGVAVETPNGLVVAVVKDVDQKSILDLAKELVALSEKAREKGLSLKEMQGSCFTLSSLGGIGGTAFTPIVNMPDVAILGVSRSQTKPIYDKAGKINPRLMLPLSLSYDHRVIDGAAAARFTTFFAQQLADAALLTLS